MIGAGSTGLERAQGQALQNCKEKILRGAHPLTGEPLHLLQHSSTLSAPAGHMEQEQKR